MNPWFFFESRLGSPLSINRLFHTFLFYSTFNWLLMVRCWPWMTWRWPFDPNDLLRSIKYDYYVIKMITCGRYIMSKSNSSCGKYLAKSAISFIIDQPVQMTINPLNISETIHSKNSVLWFYQIIKSFLNLALVRYFYDHHWPQLLNIVLKI